VFGVDEDVDAAEPISDLPGHRRHRLVVAGVGGDGDHRSRTRAVQPFGDASQLINPPRDKRHVGAFSRQRASDREPDPPATAGDDRAAAAQLEVHGDLIAFARRARATGRRSRA
jgi:hypothetical protein